MTIFLLPAARSSVDRAGLGEVCSTAGTSAPAPAGTAASASPTRPFFSSVPAADCSEAAAGVKSSHASTARARVRPRPLPGVFLSPAAAPAATATLTTPAVMAASTAEMAICPNVSCVRGYARHSRCVARIPVRAALPRPARHCPSLLYGQQQPRRAVCHAHHLWHRRAPAGRPLLWYAHAQVRHERLACTCGHRAPLTVHLGEFSPALFPLSFSTKKKRGKKEGRGEGRKCVAASSAQTASCRRGPDEVRMNESGGHVACVQLRASVQ